MYYPGMTEDPFFSDITRFEYNYSYFTFSILNVTNFNTITLPKLIKEYNPDTDINIPQSNKYDIRDEKHYYTVKMNNSENTFQKGENIFNYFIYPIFFDNYNLNSDNNNINQFENFIDFICQCLEWNPNDRITPEEGNFYINWIYYYDVCFIWSIYHK